jgi:transposase
LHQKSGRREEVSVAAAVWLSPRRDRPGLFFKTPVNGDFNDLYSAASLEALVKELAGRVVVVWDRGGTHQGDPIRDLQDVMADRLGIEELPPYAPTRNPAEPVWSWLKWGRLSNFAPDDATHLNERVVSELTAIRDDHEALRSFRKASELPLPRALFS